MLLLGAKNLVVDGVTVFTDHADPNQFWYLPAPVVFTRHKDGQAAFTFIKYKPAAVAAGVKGGGYCLFGTSLKIDSATESRILGKLGSLGAPTSDARLSPVPFDAGTCRVIALNLEGSGGTFATPAPAGAFNAVEKILGSTMPSLWGDNSAVFGLTLSQEGAIIMEQAFQQRTDLLGVIYELKFTGMRPALDVKITADFKRIYDQFSASLTGQYYFLKASIEAGLEYLRQTGAIKIEVTNSAPDDPNNQKKKWALDFFTSKLLNDWFEPTLTPGQLAGKPVTGDDSGSTTPTPTRLATTSATTTPTPTRPATTSATTPTPTPTTTGTTAPHTAQRTHTAATDNRATFEVVIRDPDPSPAGFDVTCTPSDTGGPTETVTVTGGRAPQVRVDGDARTLDAQHQFTVDVAAGTSHEIVVTDPAVPARLEDFFLFFDFDRPNETWVAGHPDTNANYQSYLANSPNPADGRFLDASTKGQEDAAQGGRPAPQPEAPVPQPHGVDALNAWLQTLTDPKTVSVSGFASYEGGGADRNAQQAHNYRLSGRRADVATGIIGSSATVNTPVVWDGEETAHNTGTHYDDHWRVAKVRGNVGAGGDEARIIARLSRGNAPTPTTTPTPTGGSTTPTPTGTRTTPTPSGGSPTPTPTGTRTTPTPTGSGGPTPTGGGIAGNPQVALKLKYIHQDEQKTLVFEYHRQEAVQRPYNPPGLIGLMIQDLQQSDIHFVEVDLDDPFFRVFAITVDAPIDYARLGLVAAHVALDYGDLNDEHNHKHGDFQFTAADHAQKVFQVFMDKTFDITFQYTLEYHFDPQSGWDGSKYTYQFPATRTDNRTMVINPFEQLGFLEVKVFPERIDAQVVASTDVHLSHTQPGGAVAQKTIVVTAASQPQYWRLRTDDPNDLSYSYYFVHHLKDGTTRQTTPVTTTATSLPVDDPFDQSIEIDFIPLFDTTVVREAFLDVTYDDPDNKYHRAERFTILAAQRDALSLRIALFNPDLRTYKYRVTYVLASTLQRGDYIETDETLIGLMG